MRTKAKYGGLLIPALLAGLVYACGSDETSVLGSDNDDEGQSSGAATSVGGATPSGSSGSGGADLFDAGMGTDAEEDACAATVVEAKVTLKPADIIFVIDNSGSMTQEIAGVEQNININFATIIGNSGVDYQVLMLTDHGPGSLDVCVEAPLSTIPAGGCPSIGSNPPGNNAGKFYHYSHNVQSHDAFCEILDTFNKPETQFNLAPTGWQAWLRPEAIKVFVMITDDGTSCTWNGTNFNDGNDSASGQVAAVEFDKKLTGLSPIQFGTQAERNYMWYSIIGLGEKSTTNPLEPHDEFDPVVTTECSGAVDPGTAYQWLSKGTSGLRFPVCNANGYDVVFNAIAAGVVEGAAVPCEYIVPEPPPGETIDLNTLEVKYTPGGGGMPITFQQVSSAAGCGPDRFYIDGDLIKLCPEACQLVTSDNDALIEVEVGCGELTN